MTDEQLAALVVRLVTALERIADAIEREDSRVELVPKQQAPWTMRDVEGVNQR